jgi:hypothetical protein
MENEKLEENRHIAKQDKSGVERQNPEIEAEVSVNERVSHNKCQPLGECVTAYRGPDRHANVTSCEFTIYWDSLYSG